MPKPPLRELKRSKYRRLGLVGNGQFGQVYCASHRKSGTLVALKNLEHERFPTHKFLRELRFLLSLQHRNIVNCEALEHTSTGRHLVMDYCEGGTLRGLMEREGCLSLGQGLQLIINVLTGLAHAHSRGVIHCDIKPENILLVVQPQGWSARISDFGIARLAQELKMELDAGGATGSPAYMSPERFYGQYSHSSDIYAVGIMLYEMLVGDRPFFGSHSDLKTAHLNQAVTIPDILPEVLHPIILKALQKLPARRYKSADEMLAVLQQALQSEELAEAVDKVRLPLMPQGETLRINFFRSQVWESLSSPITDMLVTPSRSQSAQAWLYQVRQHQSGSQVLLRPNGATIAPNFPLVHTIPEPVRELVVRPQGCFMLTTRSIYLVEHPSSAQSLSDLMPQRLLQLDTDFQATIDLHGRWIATVLSYSQVMQSFLTIWRSRGNSLGDGHGVYPVKPPCKCQTTHPAKAIALDLRHIAVVSCGQTSANYQPSLLPSWKTPPDSSNSSGMVTHFEIFTRRGTALGSWDLPIPTESVTRSSRPYRMMAIDQTAPFSALLIDIKPPRVFRVRLTLQPTIIVATSWGYVLADRQGQLSLLDEHGFEIGQIAPAKAMMASDTIRVTAIVPITDSELLMSFWDDQTQEGSLHYINLKDFTINFIF